MTSIWLRHGTCEDGLRRPRAHARPDSALTEQGEREVIAAAMSHSEAVTLILTSPLRRAVASAAILSDRWQVPVAPPDERLAEWRAPSCVLGREPTEYPPPYRAWQRRRLTEPDDALPGGESLRALADRAESARVHVLTLAERIGLIVVVSHRVFIGCIAARSAGIDDPADMFTFARRFTIEPAGSWRLTDLPNFPVDQDKGHGPHGTSKPPASREST
ncbi:histidine phosphatase family protein [Actinoallomurus purpureus]|uniref:histidine phosphatase family protein n=1 Tax=Actinoallomurus purpureus TaxID=478114 RepID=UPI003555F3C2